MFKFVKNEKKYHEFIRNLRNDERVQKELFDNSSFVTEEQQKEYMKKYNDNFYICLRDKKAVGYIRQIDGEIALSVNPDYWNQGVGTFMINEIMKVHPECFSKVKPDNHSSKRAFEKAGFKVKYYIMGR
jgi:RimJ/RimL family protein N-acetyltransferase|tara:strand:- start:2490 stop:2876 length:387 start_codon:yes stop_codon:yes gene_type:complete